MKIFDLKYRLHRSLDTFGYSAFFAMIVIALLFFIQKDLWLLIFAPSILIFSIIGLHYVSRGLLILSKKEGDETEMTEDEYVDKLYGIQGFRFMFLLSAFIIAFCGAFIFYAFDPAFLSFSAFSWVSLIFMAFLLYSTYKVSQELSFVILSVTIIDTMKTIAKSE